MWGMLIEVDFDAFFLSFNNLAELLVTDSSARVEYRCLFSNHCWILIWLKWVESIIETCIYVVLIMRIILRICFFVVYGATVLTCTILQSTS